MNVCFQPHPRTRSSYLCHFHLAFLGEQFNAPHVNCPPRSLRCERLLERCAVGGVNEARSYSIVTGSVRRGAIASWEMPVHVSALSVGDSRVR